MLNKPKIELKYNNNDCTSDFLRYMQNITYTDYEEGQTDELEITLNDDKHLFKNEFYPVKSDTITASIKLGDEALPLGDFTTDEPEFSGDSSGHSVSIKGIATGINIDVRTKRAERYPAGSIKKLVNKIAQRHKLNVLCEKDIKIPEQVQAKETDLAFLQRVAKTYGYIFKITGKYLVFIALSSSNESEPVMELKPEDINSYSFKDTSNKCYKYCEVTYYSPSSKKLLKYRAESNEDVGNSDVLKLNLKCLSFSEAKRIAHSSLTSNKVITASINPKKPELFYVAGVNVKISGFGKFDGIYHIKSSRHSINSNLKYEISLELERITEGS